MKNNHISIPRRQLSVSLLLCLFSFSAFCQYEFKPPEGYSKQVGVMVYMLEDLKNRITDEVKDLDVDQTDFLFDEKANSVGAMIMHLIATESYYQVETLEGRSWTEEEVGKWAQAGGLGDESRKAFKGQPAQYYLDLWDEVRQKTLAGLKEKDDDWLATSIEEGIDNHWVWYHVMEHQANHMGQIALVKNRMTE